MRIAYVCHYFVPEPAAPAARVHEMARAWTAAGHEVSVVTAFPNFPNGVLPPRYRGRLLADEQLDGMRVLRSWVYAAPHRGVGPRGLNHLSFMASATLLSLPRLGPRDVVVASSPPLFAALAGWAMARARGAPFVLEVRDLWPQAFVDIGVMREGRALRALAALADFLYARASRVVVVTQGFADHLAARGVDRARLAVIPNGADTRRFAPRNDGPSSRRRFGLDDRFLAAYVGSHGLAHGLDIMLDAAAALPDAAFLLVGDGAERPRLLAEKARRGLDNLTMLPSVPRDDVAALYAAADVCVVSLRDVPILATFIPSKMFEIMAAGRPIVAAVRGEPRAILEASGAALLVEPGDGAGLARALDRLRADSGLRAEMGRRGRAFVERHYDRDLLARRYLDLLRDVVGAR